jgi:hypothetical protein
VNGVNSEDPVSPYVVEVVTEKKQMPVCSEGPMKIMEDEKSSKPESTPPERIRNPRVQVIVIRWRRVVRNNGRTLLSIIIVNDCLVGIAFRGCFCRSVGYRTRWSGGH